MNYFTKESSHSGKKINEKREMVKYIFHISSWSHFSLTNLPSHLISFHFIFCVRTGQRGFTVKGDSDWAIEMKIYPISLVRKMRDGWYICFVRNELLLILFYHLISLSQSLPLLAFIRALVADERGERKKNMRWDGLFSSLSQLTISISHYSDMKEYESSSFGFKRKHLFSPLRSNMRDMVDFYDENILFYHLIDHFISLILVLRMKWEFTNISSEERW